MINKTEIIEIWNSSTSLAEITKKIYGYTNTRVINKVKEIGLELGLELEILNKNLKNNRTKYNLITKICPVCESEFQTKLGHAREKVTCSHSCSNTYFRSGSQNPNWNNDTYRSTCFEFHKKECVICKEQNIVEVHHFDENRNNNKIENLIPLCPTHHRYWHSSFKEYVYEDIINYRDEFIKKRGC